MGRLGDAQDTEDKSSSLFCFAREDFWLQIQEFPSNWPRIRMRPTQLALPTMERQTSQVTSKESKGFVLLKHSARSNTNAALWQMWQVWLPHCHWESFCLSLCCLQVWPYKQYFGTVFRQQRFIAQLKLVGLVRETTKPSATFDHLWPGQCSPFCRLPHPALGQTGSGSCWCKSAIHTLHMWGQVLTLDGWCDDIVRHVVYRQPVMGVTDLAMQNNDSCSLLVTCFSHCFWGARHNKRKTRLMKADKPETSEAGQYLQHHTAS